MISQALIPLMIMLVALALTYFIYKILRDIQMQKREILRLNYDNEKKEAEIEASKDNIDTVFERVRKRLRRNSN